MKQLLHLRALGRGAALLALLAAGCTWGETENDRSPPVQTGTRKSFGALPERLARPALPLALLTETDAPETRLAPVAPVAWAPEACRLALDQLVLQSRPIGVRPRPRPGEQPTERRIYTTPYYLTLGAKWVVVGGELGYAMKDGPGLGLLFGYTLPIQSLRRAHQALSVELGYSISMHDREPWDELTLWINQVPFGFRWTFMTDRVFQPYLRAGGEYHIIAGEWFANVSGWGGYLGGGIDYFLPWFNRHMSVGLDVEGRLGSAGTKGTGKYNLAIFTAGLTATWHF